MKHISSYSFKAEAPVEYILPLRVLESGVTLKVRYACLILGECGRDVHISGSIRVKSKVREIPNGITKIKYHSYPQNTECI